EVLKVASEIRAAGISAAVYFGKASPKEQFAYANATGIPVAVILGPGELEKGEISVKNLLAGKQQRADMDREAYKNAHTLAHVNENRSESLTWAKNFLAQASGAPATPA